jgi:hypothetical protein
VAKQQQASSNERIPITPHNWKHLLEHEGDAILSWLESTEAEFVRMIYGIWLFIRMRIPELFRRFIEWLKEKFAYAFRVVFRLARVVVAFVACVAIVFGPLVVYPNAVTELWLILALTGSVWGYRRQLKNHTLVRPAGKEHDHA